MNTVVYETDYIVVETTGRDYDFFAFIENKTDENIRIICELEDGECAYINIEAHDWVGLLCNDEDRLVYKNLINNKYVVKNAQD